MSSKNNINMNHYKIRGRGRQGEAVVHNDHKHSFAQVGGSPGNDVENRFRGAQKHITVANRLAKFSRLQRLKRSRKIRGLSAKQLMERKMSRHAARQNKSERFTTAASVPHSATQTAV